MNGMTIKTDKMLHRTFDFNRASLNKDQRTVDVSFSSETPVERWFGIEILDHRAQSVRLGRLQSGGPVLVGHNDREQIGVVESATIGPDRKGRAVLRVFCSARAEDIYQDILDGIRRMSCGLSNPRHDPGSGTGWHHHLPRHRLGTHGSVPCECPCGTTRWAWDDNLKL